MEELIQDRTRICTIGELVFDCQPKEGVSFGLSPHCKIQISQVSLQLIPRTLSQAKCRQEQEVFRSRPSRAKVKKELYYASTQIMPQPFHSSLWRGTYVKFLHQY